MKKTILSGIKPSGDFTLGNYIGALRNFKKLQDKGEFICQYFIADLHAITVRQDPQALTKRSLDIMKIYLSLGLGGGEHNIFYQSHVPEHAELGWVLGCFTHLGELSRMTQFKDKSAKNEEGITSGLFTYPVLMAADILLYQADLVPVGVDQKQHLELTRDIAARFNGIYGETFKLPEPFIPENGARIMGLQNPRAKMSKSEENPNDCILLLDTPDVIVKKIKRAVTDSLGTVVFDENNPERAGINNLINIYSSLTDKTREQIQNEFDGHGYGDFKKAVAESVVEELRPMQTKFQELSADDGHVKKIYTESAEKARELAKKTLKDVYDKIGFIKR